MGHLEVGQQSPGSHRGSGHALHVASAVVALLVLAEAAVELLHGHQPAGDVGHPLLAHVVADAGEAGEDRADCVDIVDAPAGRPHAVVAGLEEVLDAPADDLGVVDVSLAHAFEEVADDVGARRVEDLRTFIYLCHPKD